MKKFYLSALLFLGALIMYGQAQAQLTGTVTIPSTNYPTLQAAIDSLNAQGVGAGGVTINLLTGNPQTAPAGGYLLGSAVLNTSVSATKTITINGNGNAITPFIGTGATDAFFKLRGLDYLTMDGFVLAESATNTTGITRMEYGIAMLNANSTAPFDGCQNVTIKNCNISLNRTSTNATVGIYSTHTTATSTTALSITAAGDAHSNIKIYSNTFSNCIAGVRMEGFAAPSPYTLYDQNNDIGGNSAATGNTIINQGNVTAWNMFGFLMLNQNGGSCSYNTIDPAQGSRGNNTQSIGIYATGLDFTANNNNIKIITASGAALYTSGINAENTGNLTANDNRINFVDSGGTNERIHIYTASAKNIVVNGNTCQASTGSASIGGKYWFIYNETAALNETITNNVFDNINLRTTGNIIGIYAVSATPVVNISGNRINGSFTRTASGATYFIYNTAVPTSGTSTINNNNFSNVTTTGTGATYGIYYTTGAAHSHTISGDTLSNWTNPGAGLMYGIYLTAGSANNVFNNIVSNLNTTYNGTCYGIYAANNAAAGALNVYGNTVAGITSGGASLYGMYVSATGTANIYRNNLNNLTAATSTGAVAYGLYVNAAATMNLYNNMVSDIKTPAASGTSPVYGLYFNAGTAINAYHNTINLTPVSTGTNFGATGIYYAAGVGALDLRNNIVRVAAAAAGTGTTVALRRSTGTAGTAPANLAQTSNGNIYYVPAATNHYLYNEGTSTTAVNGFNTTNDPAFNTACGAYKKFMTPRESATFTENNLVQIGTTTTYAPAGSSYAEAGAVATTAPAVTLDMNGVNRGTAPDIGALQFTGTAAADGVAPAITYTTLPLTTFCTTPPTLTATITDASGVNNTAGTKPRLYYKKSTESDAFGGGNTSAANGWKYVEGTNSGTVYTFTFDYNLLNTPVAIGDSIIYFVVAQDNAATPNVGNSRVGFAAGYCPASVNILAAGAPLQATPVANSYKIIAVPAFIASANPTVLCNSGPTTLTLSPALTGAATLQWQQDNGAGFVNVNGATTTPYTTANLSGATTFRAIVSCGVTPVATSLTVTLNPLPRTVVTPAGPVNICSGSSVTLNGPTTPAGLSYQWKNGVGNAPGTSTNAAYTTSVAGNYRLIVSTASGCKDSSDIVVVTVSPLPIVAMSPSAPTTGCDSVVLSTANTGVTYQWNYNGTPIQGATSATYAARSSGNYSLTNTSTVSGCFATTPNVAITVNQSPLGQITYSSPLIFCQGGGVVLNTYTAANQTYEWRNNTIAIPGATGASYTTTQDGIYSVYVVNTATNCARLSQAVVVQVNPLPKPQVVYNSFSNTLSTTTPYPAYQWYVNTQPIPGATGATHTPASNGAYAVSVTDTNGCVNISPIVFVNSVGVEASPLAAQIKVYPNPASNILHVDAPVKVTLVLRDATGKVVLKSEDSRELDVARISDGIYLMYITTQDGRLIRVEKITRNHN